MKKVLNPIFLDKENVSKLDKFIDLNGIDTVETCCRFLKQSCKNITE